MTDPVKYDGMSDSPRQFMRTPTAQQTGAQSHSALEHAPDNHLSLIYETTDEQLAAVVPFIQQGLKQNERVMYVLDENTQGDITTALHEAGVDVETALDSGALTFHAPADTYQRDDGFAADDMIEFLDETARKVVTRDEYTRLRLTGEMTWILDADAAALDRLADYEATLNEYYPGQPAIGLCQYNRTRFSADLLHDIVRTHPHHIYDATVSPNPAYRPPDEFTTADAPAAHSETFVDMHLDRLRAYSDVHAHEHTLATLAASSQDLMHGDTHAIIDRVTDAVHQALPPAVVGVFLYDDSTDDLQPHTVHWPYTANTDTDTLGEQYENLLWDTFVTDDSTLFSNRDAAPVTPDLDPALHSGMALPLPRHGVLFVGAPQPEAFTDADVEFVRTVAATAQAALERADHEQTLEAQNDRLHHLNQINRTIRRIQQALVQASSREDIATVVCDQLAATDSYQFAWIGDRDPLTDDVRPQHWAGNGVSYLDAIYTLQETDTGDTLGTSSTSSTPASAALTTGDVSTVSNLLTAPAAEEWRDAALANGFRSMVSIPLLYNETEYGVLTVCATETNGFTDMEQEVLEELGATIAYAIDAVEMQASLHEDQRIEVGLYCTDVPCPLLRLAQRTGGQFDVDTVIPETDETLRLFFTATNVSADKVRTSAAQFASIDEIRHVADRDTDQLFESVVNVKETFLATVVAFDASITGLTATADGVELEVELPQTADVRAFVDEFTAAYPATEVQSIQRVTDSAQTPESFYAAVTDALTDRQFEALQLAYYSGYFEWPRESTGETVAESLGVTQPTLNGHLRAGQRKLFDLLFSQ